MTREEAADVAAYAKELFPRTTGEASTPKDSKSNKTQYADR